MLPVHVACDRRAPAYRGDGRKFVGWMLGLMRERADETEDETSLGGAPSVDAWLQKTVPPAFFARGCDHALLGIEAPPELVETREVAEYHDLDDPLFG